MFLGPKVESVMDTDIMEDVLISETMVETRVETVMVRDTVVEDSESMVEANSTTSLSEFMVEVVVGTDVVMGAMMVSETVMEAMVGTGPVVEIKAISETVMKPIVDIDSAAVPEAVKETVVGIDVIMEALELLEIMLNNLVCTDAVIISMSIVVAVDGTDIAVVPETLVDTIIVLNSSVAVVKAMIGPGSCHFSYFLCSERP